MEYEKQFFEYMQSRIATDPAHDIEHIKRVVLNAKKFAAAENAELNIVLPAAWLHDCITLPKNDPNRKNASQLAADEALRFLKDINYPDIYLKDVHQAILSHSYSANIPTESLEAKVVQDADRIDALGAIGIARTLMVGGALGRTLYAPSDPLCENRSPNDLEFTIDHFYKKLFKICDTMHTASAKKEALKRTEIMRLYLKALKDEIQI